MSIEQRGVGMVELMVGVVIAMIGSLIIFQVVQNADARRRSTVSASDTQVTGSVGMFNIDRDLKQGGFNFGRGAWDLFGCSVKAFDASRTAPDPTSFEFRFDPVRIVPAQANRSQAIEVLIGSSPILNAPVAFSAPTATTKVLQSRAGFSAGDFVLVQQPNADPNQRCELVRVTQVLAATNAMEHTGGTFNANPPRVNFAGSGSTINLGARPRLMRYYIQGGSLIAENGIGPTVTRTAVADGMVDLQAQYGIDNNNDGVIDVWNTATPATAAEWRQLLAVRIAVLARSGQYERVDPSLATPPVTPVAPRWTGGAFVLTNLDGSSGTPADPTLDWRNYRYRVYQTTVMLRNLIWGR